MSLSNTNHWILNSASILVNLTLNAVTTATQGFSLQRGFETCMELQNSTRCCTAKSNVKILEKYQVKVLRFIKNTSRYIIEKFIALNLASKSVNEKISYNIKIQRNTVPLFQWLGIRSFAYLRRSIASSRDSSLVNQILSHVNSNSRNKHNFIFKLL